MALLRSSTTGTVLACVLLLSAALTAATAAKYDTSFKGYAEDKINLHIVCHTHDDVGWLKTVDEYYMGANNSIQHAGVQYILDSVMPALKANPDRKFLYIEQAFFQRWWRQQDADIQALTKELHKNGQLHFANGGWCMHDEANTHYIAMVDQTTLGHRWLLEEFGALPTVGWQIDPFGHSATQAALLSAEAGFNSLFFGRIDYQDRATRLKEHRMEMVWRASKSLGASAQVFAGAFQSGNYGPPGGYCFDQFCSDPPMQTDPALEDVNIKSRVDGFVKAAQDHYNNSPGTGHIMFKMGSDFQYENANEWMKNLDKLIHYTNLDGRINVFYSDPDAYTRAVNAANHTWTVKTDDFFPYADCPHCYWTGYFTSRPALKGYIRKAGAFLNVAKQLEAQSGRNGSRLERFEEAMGVAQHHDAVAGTEKQHVAFDYAKRIAWGTADGVAIVNDNLATLTSKAGFPQVDGSQFSQCQLLNESICVATQSNDALTVIVYNQEARPLTQPIRLPVQSETLAVFNSSNDHVASQLTPNKFAKKGAAPYTLTFQANLPAAGFATFFVKAPSTGQEAAAAALHAASSRLRGGDSGAGDSTITISNEFLSMSFDSTSGRATTLRNLASGVAVALTQEWMYWNSSASGNGWGNTVSKQNSGAYIFRPNGTSAFAVNSGNVAISVTRGPVVQEVTQVWAPWLHQITRIYAGAREVETEFTVGPVPFAGDLGKEVITRYKTNISSAEHYYTDSNGREMQTRIKNFRPTWKLNVTEPVAGNYYPVNALAYIKDDNAQFTILTDRSEGGSSLNDGELEIMVHRRIMFDDGRGVGEPLNETTSCTPYPDFRRLGTGLVITAKHRLQLEPPASAAEHFRAAQQKVYSEAVPVFAPLTTSVPDYVAAHTTTRSLLSAPLPANVGLMTLAPFGDNTVLLRLAHLFGVDEDPVLSKPATVDLATMFADLQIDSVQEMSLTANQPLSNVHRLTWKTDSEEEEQSQREVHPTGPPGSITLGPMQIRTFELTLK